MRRAALCGLAAILVLVGTTIRARETKPLAPYPSLEEIYQQADSLAQSRPELVRLDEIGQSVEGRPIYLLRFGAGEKSKPQALIAAGIHAEEFIGPALALAAARKLAAGNGEFQGLLDQVEIDILPSVNPDGYARVYSDGGKGGKIGGRKNAAGVDLNRNFPLVPGAKSRHPLAGNHRPKSNYYMGPAQLSEPETRAVAELVESGRYFLVINLHSVAGKFLYPYTHSKKIAPDKALFEEIGGAFAAAQKDYHYKIEQSYAWYPTLGDPDDYFYLWFGIPSFTIEIGRISQNLLDRGLKTFKIFWAANPGKKFDYWIENDAAALLAAVQKAYHSTGGKPLPRRPPGGK